MTKTSRFISSILLAILALSACNLPSKAPGTQGSQAAMTAAAQTVEAQLTLIAPQNTPTTANIPPANTATSQPPTSTSAPPTATISCDIAEFVADVTIPDDTIMTPGQTFTKTWRLKNVGACSWTTAYAVVFFDGNSMSGPTTQALTGNVNPGQTVDVSVNLTAPNTPGTYRGNYRLRNASGVLFAKFYVEIKVQNPTSSGYDLHTRAPQAEWKSGAGNLTFGGPDTDPNGFAMYRNGQKLEDGSTPGKVLEMHPQWVDNGVITGLFPAYSVVSGEHFKARIGFLAFPDGTCGAGNATFQLNYKENGILTPLGSWNDSCDGSMINVDVNLNSIAGHTVQFALAVLANGSSAQDWAVWVSPRVEIP
jgi:hypothetical protein